jgi:hypothetical protein
MWLSNTQQFMRTDVVTEQTVKGEKKTEVLRPEDMMGIFGVQVDDGSFEPISKDQKRTDFMQYKDFILGVQGASVAQAERTQDPNQAVNIDFGELLQRGSEHFGESSSHFVIDNTQITPQNPTAPTEETPPEDPNAPVPEGIEDLMGQLGSEPLSPEASGAVRDPLDISNIQPDGKTMPNTFPVRSVNNPVLGA